MRALLTPLLSTALLLGTLAPVSAQEPSTPTTTDPYYAGFVIPRARIKAVDAPKFVPASEAKLPDEAWVFGVVVDGEARAYSLNLLNHHETVNDQVGDKPFAVVWCPLANAAAVYGRRYDGRDLAFEPDGGLLNASLVVRDRETDSLWSILTGDAIEGDFAGTPLDQWPAGEKVPWKQWRSRHPETLVLSVDGREHIRSNPYDMYFESSTPFRGIEAKDSRLPSREPVFAFQLGQSRYAVPYSAFEGGAAIDVGGRALFLFRPPGAEVHQSTLAFQAGEGEFDRRGGDWVHSPSGASFEREAGVFTGGRGPTPPRVEGLDTFWYMWSLTHPDTHVLEPALR